MHWREALRKDAEANQTFTARLEVLKDAAVRQMEDAAVWEVVLEARGKKKILDLLLTELKMDDREEAAHARAFGPSRATKSS